MKIAIIGASGFVGSALLNKLNHEIIALSRKEVLLEPRKNVTWKKCDLFSLSETIDSLKGVDVVIYLVHSMSPINKLAQGDFLDYDLLLADNVKIACEKNNIKQIIYLSGIMPEKNLSKHLKSRKEVEDIFKNLNFSILRAGMIIGDQGSSFSILKNLINNLLILIIPKWGNNKTQVVSLNDVTYQINKSIENETRFKKIYNLTSGETLTYKDLIKRCSKFYNKKRIIFSVPINIISISKYWVSYFGNSSIELVSPLLESLKHDIIANNNILISKKEKSLEDILINIKKINKPVKFKKEKEMNDVRSIQRVKITKNCSIRKLSLTYFNWINSKFLGIIRVKRKKDIFTFKLFFINLISLKLIKEKSNSKRDIFFIIDGLLVKRKDHGWIEIRKIQNNFLFSLHDFSPSLPWFIYKNFQALIHLFVMNTFMKSINKKGGN